MALEPETRGKEGKFKNTLELLLEISLGGREPLTRAEKKRRIKKGRRERALNEKKGESPKGGGSLNAQMPRRERSIN